MDAGQEPRQAPAPAAAAAASASAAAAASASASAAEPLYGGFTRFELELEFVQSLANPWYLNYLAQQKYLDKPEFVDYLRYLQYFARPEYTKHLTHPAPTLRALELLQQERFRKEIIMPAVVARLIEQGVRASTENRP